MRQSALLARRLPLRLRRWRTVAPEDASMGQTPHSAAKDPSVRIRSGLSPAATSSADATSAPTPRAPSSAGLACSHSRSSSASSSSISVLTGVWRVFCVLAGQRGRGGQVFPLHRWFGCLVGRFR